MQVGFLMHSPRGCVLSPPERTWQALNVTTDHSTYNAFRAGGSLTDVTL